MLVSELLLEIDSTTHDRVKQTIEQWRRPVQDALKAELRMGLSWRPREDDGETFQCSSPVSLDKIGAPTRTARVRGRARHLHESRGGHRGRRARGAWGSLG